MCGAPVLFQRVADPVIEVEDQKSKDTGGRRIQHKCQQAPDLTAQDKCGIKTEIGKKCGVRDADKPENYVCNRKIPHQIRNPEMGMFIAKPVDKPHGVFHWIDLLMEMGTILFVSYLFLRIKSIIFYKK